MPTTQPLNPHPTRRSLCTALGGAGALALAAPLQVLAQPATFPAKPVTVVAPYPPGGAADTISRIVARHMALQIAGSSFVVENKAGAGTVVGAQAVAQAAPDGHTLLVSSNTTFTLNPALRPKLPYDPVRSYESLGMLGGIPLLLLAHPSFPANSVRELVAMAKAQPGKLSYASFGTGTTSHFAGEMFKSAAGVDIVHVPYKGSAPAMQDLLGNQIPLSFDTNVPSVPQIQTGKLKALAVTSARRLSTLPNVPTMAESGYPGFELTAWLTVVAPRGLSEPVRRTLVKALADALATPAMQADLVKAGVEVLYEAPTAYEERVNRELPAMRTLVERAGIKAD